MPDRIIGGVAPGNPRRESGSITLARHRLRARISVRSALHE